MCHNTLLSLLSYEIPVELSSPFALVLTLHFIRGMTDSDPEVRSSGRAHKEGLSLSARPDYRLRIRQCLVPYHAAADS